MSFNFEKMREKPALANGEFWTSYADLATVLSILFLLMYAIATLRTTTVSVAERASRQIAMDEIDDLKAQIKAFDVLKDEYLEAGASTSEKKMYQDLMGQMKLMQQQAQAEKVEFYKQAQEAEAKAKGLNRYQAMIKNIIAANMIAQSEIKGRDTIIAKKSKNITELRRSVRQKEREIAQNNQEIETQQQKLEQSIAELKYAYRSKARSRKQMEDAITKLKEDSAARVDELKRQNVQVSKQLVSAKGLIDAQSTELQAKESALSEKETQVAKLEQERQAVLADLSREQARFQQSITDLRAAHRAQVEQERQAYEQSLHKEKLSAQARLEKEQEYRERVEAQKLAYDQRMGELANQLAGTKAEIGQKERELASTRAASMQKEQRYKAQLAESEAQKQQIRGELEAQQRGYQQSMADLKRGYLDKLEGERQKYQAGLAQEKLSGDAKLAREQAYRGMLEREKAAYDSQMKALSNQLEGTKRAIANREAQFQSDLHKVSSAKAGLERQLASVRAREEAKKRLVDKIQEGFRRAGIDAAVNPNTGEVTLNFGQEYFETGSAVLTGGMKKTLEQAFPVYAQSILEDPELAKKINSVEIIGFASPTFQGKYVDPKALSPGARQAVNYNMDLSYQRAKSIFAYVFDPKRVAYKHQRDLLGISKVSGLGYLRSQGAEDGVDGGLSHSQYCEKYDCTKSQKVIIKFNFAER